MRRIILIIGLFVMVLSMTLLVITLSGCQSSFTGDRIKNPDAYLIDFDSMTGTDSHSILMEKDQELQVEYKVTKGRVDLEVQEEGGDLVYRGNGLEEGDFTLIAGNTGTYQISIKAKRAQGFLHIQKK
ncbi:MAG: hypothetical protein KBS81_00045 [Spirochaetales bacterium]|nr:hypothetical protein [Candidatus Physcosoma equi]